MPDSPDQTNTGVDAPVGPDASSAELCGPVPSSCIGRCQTQSEQVQCCDSITCNCNPRMKKWEVVACDPPPPPPDGGRDWGQVCPRCQPGYICVIDYDGVCNLLGAGRCVETTCTTCSEACDQALCQDRHFSCAVAPCEPLPQGIFACYGP